MDPRDLISKDVTIDMIRKGLLSVGTNAIRGIKAIKFLRRGNKIKDIGTGMGKVPTTKLIQPSLRVGGKKIKPQTLKSIVRNRNKIF